MSLANLHQLTFRIFTAVMVVGSMFVPSGCANVPGGSQPAVTSARTGGVTFIRPRCVEVRSCLLGQVTAAESAAPLAEAAVFLERLSREREVSDSEPVRILTLTDEQGVFTVVDAPAGRYRIAVYKDTRMYEARGLELGAPGTTVVPVRLPPS